VIATVHEFAHAYESGGFTCQNRDRFNAAAAARYEGIRDYIVAHFRMNQRTDTDYWRANAANQALSDPLKAMMTAWFTHGDIAQVNREAYGRTHYSTMSWHALFAGYGTFPSPEKTVPLPKGVRDGDLAMVTAMLDACVQNFPDRRPGL